jgi:hypothetical protein
LVHNNSIMSNFAIAMPNYKCLSCGRINHDYPPESYCNLNCAWNHKIKLALEEHDKDNETLNKICELEDRISELKDRISELEDRINDYMTT